MTILSRRNPYHTCRLIELLSVPLTLLADHKAVETGRKQSKASFSKLKNDLQATHPIASGKAVATFPAGRFRPDGHEQWVTMPARR